MWRIVWDFCWNRYFLAFYLNGFVSLICWNIHMYMIYVDDICMQHLQSFFCKHQSCAKLSNLYNLFSQQLEQFLLDWNSCWADGIFGSKKTHQQTGASEESWSLISWVDHRSVVFGPGCGCFCFTALAASVVCFLKKNTTGCSCCTLCTCCARCNSCIH